ncbi:MAG TPA: DUF2249 domain-containing protein, partial [Actinotalea sp.]
MDTLPLIDQTTTSGGCGCGGCGCGGGGAETATVTELPTELPTDVATAASVLPAEAATAPSALAGDLDVRALAPAQRHERIFAAVAALLPGEAFVLTNDHDPKPLRYQLDAEEPGQIGWEYRAEGPDVWRVEISRVAGH